MLEQGMVKPESPKFATYIGKIVGSGQHLLKMIDQVLDYARVESGKMEFNGEPVSVAAALSDVVEMLQGQSHARRITVRVQVDDSIGTIVTDPIRLTQMLFALVSNAIKFSNEDGSVEVQARVVDAQSWQVEVTDQGIGIAEANLPRLFMPFVQLSSGSTKTHGGTGIGLALVRLIAVAQGGRIEVRSQAGQGSTFTLTLPRVLDSSIFGN
jgi:signal transduction histidine kinase